MYACINLLYNTRKIGDVNTLRSLFAGPSPAVDIFVRGLIIWTIIKNLTFFIIHIWPDHVYCVPVTGKQRIT
jgi:hypothetical protein